MISEKTLENLWEEARATSPNGLQDAVEGCPAQRRRFARLVEARALENAAKEAVENGKLNLKDPDHETWSFEAACSYVIQPLRQRARRARREASHHA